MANWIQNCQICNDGLCIRFEELKIDGNSDRVVAEIMEEEAYQKYPELKNDFSASRIRNRYRYHMKKKVGEIHPNSGGAYRVPNCKKCGSRSVIMSPKTEEPMEHGLCYRCRSEELAPEKERKAEQRDKKAKEEFRQIPVDTEVERNWRKFASKIDELFDEFENTVMGGKVGREVLMDVVIPIQRRLENLTSTVIEMSTYKGKD